MKIKVRACPSVNTKGADPFKPGGAAGLVQEILLDTDHITHAVKSECYVRSEGGAIIPAETIIRALVFLPNGASWLLETPFAEFTKSWK